MNTTTITISLPTGLNPVQLLELVNALVDDCRESMNIYCRDEGVENDGDAAWTEDAE